MRLGVLDVGSNTVHLLVVDAHRGAHPTPMHDDRSVLRLAEHVGPDDQLSKAGEKALLRAVQEACRQAEKQRCDDFLAMVTSAIREASNGLEVLDRIRHRTGIDEDADVALSLPLGAGRMTRTYLPAARDGGRPDLAALRKLDSHAGDLL